MVYCMRGGMSMFPGKEQVFALGKIGIWVKGLEIIPGYSKIGENDERYAKEGL